MYTLSKRFIENAIKSIKLLRRELQKYKENIKPLVKYKNQGFQRAGGPKSLDSGPGPGSKDFGLPALRKP